jgi:predicted DNA-binding protein (MmcQ/YjbR family)
MDAEKLRAFALSLPHVVETHQWGDNLVLWCGDKAIGGKMFALLNLDGDGRGVISYLAGAEHFAELVEIEGIVPAPYFARIFWVAAETWGVHRNPVWEDEIRAAHGLTFERLPPKVKAVLALPAGERKKLIAERRKVLAAKEAAKPGKDKKGKLKG